MNNHIRLWFPYRNLTKLNLYFCNLGDEDIGSSVWELPNVQELDLEVNDFSRLDFGLLRVPKLKRLNMSNCRDLVTLSNMPSSIAVVWANDCISLETIGDISICKWLWKVSLLNGGYNMDPSDRDILLDFILQGNAIEDHIINVCVGHQIPMGFVGRFFRGKTFTKRFPHDTPDLNRIRAFIGIFTLRLPSDWCNDFCGFLMRVVTQQKCEDMRIDIIMKQEPNEEDFGFVNWQEFDEAPEPEYDGKVKTYVGYVSFNSLRRITLLTSSYNLISFYIVKWYWTSFTAELVPRKSKDGLVQPTKIATDCSKFWNKEGFEIKHDSKSSIKISWEA